jgi:hypothetical protein
MERVKTAVTLIVASAVYGFAGGSVHSLLFALRNLIKFPLLVVVTSAVCSISYYLAAKLLSVPLNFDSVQQAVLKIYRDLSVLLCGTAPPVYFLAMTIRQPDSKGLHDYPMFLAFNVILIAVCGIAAVSMNTHSICKNLGVPLKRASTLVGLWLLISLAVGAQWAWYLRPFFGVSTVPVKSFCLGTEPDFRGAASFYEALYHIVEPPNFIGS